MSNKHQSLFRLIKMAVIMLLILAVVSGLFWLSNKSRQDQSDPSQIQYVIGVSQFDLNEQWLVEMNREIENAALTWPSIRLVYTDAGGNSSKQSQDLNELMAYGIDLLMISPNDPETLNQQIAEIHQKIPVILLSRSINSDDYTTLISADNRKIGFEAGKFIADLAGNQTVNILELTGSADSQESQERSAGFRAAIEQKPNLNITTTVQGDWLQDKAENSLAEMYMELLDINIIFAHDNAMAVGAYHAVQKMRLQQIEIIGIGGSSDVHDSYDLVHSGKLECSFNNTLGGTAAMETARKILEYSGTVSKTIILDSQMITKDSEIGN